jgi:hypothetical protein
MARLDTFDVLPTNHENIIDDKTIFNLSDAEQVFPGNHTTPCVAFPLSIASAEREEFISQLRIGLQNVVTHIPLVGGQLHNDEGLISILRHNHVPIQLNVHHLDLEPGFPTYETLAASGFNSALYSSIASFLVPPGANLGGFRRDDGCPVAVFQVSFIRGGVLVTVALHHMCGDARSIDHIFSLWAASTKAAKEGHPMPTWSPIIDRSYFCASSTPNIAETEELKKHVYGFSFHPLIETLVILLHHQCHRP